MDNHAEFLVESLPIAAALIASGCDVPNVDFTNPYRAVFRFQDPTASTRAAQYIQGTLSVDARQMFSVFDDLRSAIRRGREQAEVRYVR